MRIIVLSDTHGDMRAIEKIFARNPSADLYLHLGDGERELDEMVLRYPEKDIRHVAGNCDFASLSPEMLVIGVQSHKLLAVHGHRHGVKYSIEILKKLAEDNGADIVLFGHSHVGLQHYEDGITFLNPGSASQPRDGNPPTYGFVDITDAGIVTNLVRV